MKELILNRKGLTTQAQEGYSNGGVIFMEGKTDMSHNSQPANPEHSEVKPIQKQPVSLERQAMVRKAALKKLSERSDLPVDVRQALEDLIRENEPGDNVSMEKTRGVMKNASLGDSERIDSVIQLLERDLTKEEREALLKAHSQGKGEFGKDNNKAGIYNYTEGQLLRKARILKEAGFSEKERRVLMEAGLVGAPIDDSGISDSAIVAKMEAMNNSLEMELQPSLIVLNEALHSVGELVGVNPAERQIAIDRIKERIVEEKETARKEGERSKAGEEIRYRFSLSFMPEDQKLLSERPTQWLNEQFNLVYALAEEGQELSSPLIQDTQQKISLALDLIRHSNPEHLKEFIAQSTVRLHLLQMRTAIGYKDMDQVKGAAQQLRAHGLLLGMQLEQGKVGAMFNRFQDMLEETRQWSNKRHHVMLEDALRVQKLLIDEQMGLAKKGKGSFGDLSDISDINKNPDVQTDFASAADEMMTDMHIEKAERETIEAMQVKEITQDQKTDGEKTLAWLERIRRIKKVNADITRAVRTAYDVFVSSQRMGVIVSRGKYLLKDGGRYRSDPIGPLNVYNMEELLFGKFDMYSPEQEEFVDRIKLDIAETYLKEQKKIQGESGKELTRQQKIDLGKRLFRDLFAVPDFFSSGWRIEGVIQALEQRFEASTFQGKPYKELLNKEELKEYQQLKSDQGRKIFLAKKRAEDFALFMRLRLSGQDQLSLKDEKGNDKTRKTREGIWGKIKNYRPEEIIRLFRERKGDRVKALYDEMVGIDPELNLTVTEKEANRPESEDGGRGRDLTVYDKFKIKYGSIIGLLRQEGFDLKDGKGNQTPTQINLSDLTTEQKKMVDSIKGNGSGEMLAKLSKKMQEYIFNKKLVDDLLVDNEFADIYTRSIIIDDILLDKLEDEKFDSVDELGVSKLGYVPLSKMIGEAGAGGDTLARSWNDTGNAATAGNSLLEFIRDEDIEKKTGAAIKFATSAGSYNGLGARGQAECLRYTIGTFLNLSKVDMVWDIIGTTSLGRVSISDVQRIFGPQAKAMSRDELRGHLDHLRGYLSSSISKVREDMREKTKAFLESDLSEEYMEEAKKYSSEDDFKKYKIKEWGEELEKDEKKSHKFYNDLEDLLEVNAGDTAKRFGFRLLLYLLLSAIGETYMIGKSSFKDSK